MNSCWLQFSSTFWQLAAVLDVVGILLCYLWVAFSGEFKMYFDSDVNEPYS